MGTVSVSACSPTSLFDGQGTDTLAVARDGSAVYATALSLANGGASGILRYTASGAACQLARDTSFGQNGAIATYPGAMHVGPSGGLWIDALDEIRRAWPAPEIVCSGLQTGVEDFAFSPDGSAAYALIDVMAQAGPSLKGFQKLTVTATSCTAGTLVAPHGTTELVGPAALAIDAAGHLDVGGSARCDLACSANGQQCSTGPCPVIAGLVEIYDTQGNIVGHAGNLKQGQNDSMCNNIDEVASCGSALCVLNQGCGAVKRFRTDGSFVDSTALGIATQYSAGFAVSASGVGFVVGQATPSTPNQVVRLTGL